MSTPTGNPNPPQDDHAPTGLSTAFPMHMDSIPIHGEPDQDKPEPSDDTPGSPG